MALPWAVVAGVVGVVPEVVAGALVVAPVPGVVTTTVLGAVDVEFVQVVDPELYEKTKSIKENDHIPPV